MKPEQVLDMQGDLQARLEDPAFIQLTMSALQIQAETGPMPDLTHYKDLAVQPGPMSSRANTRYKVGAPDSAVKELMVSGQFDRSTGDYARNFSRNRSTQMEDVLRLHVRNADAYRVTEDMSMLLQFAAAKLDDSDRYDRNLAPTPFGIVRFDRPLPLTDVRGKQMDCHWLTWGPVTTVRNTSFGTPESAPGHLLTWWNDTQFPDQVYKEMVADIDPKVMAYGRQVGGRWALNAGTIIHNDEKLGAPETDIPDDTYAKLIEEGVEVPSKYTNTARYAHALFLLLNQTVVRMEEDYVPRSAKKRLGKMPIPGRVSVITLRRTAGARQEGESTVEWQHRWMVRGHWRWQPYGDGHVERIWINAYVKGPEGKPFVVTRKVYNLSK